MQKGMADRQRFARDPHGSDHEDAGVGGIETENKDRWPIHTQDPQNHPRKIADNRQIRTSKNSQKMIIGLHTVHYRNLNNQTPHEFESISTKGRASKHCKSA